VHHLYTLSTADDLIQSVLASPSEVPIDAYMDAIAFWLPSTDSLKNLNVHLRSCLCGLLTIRSTLHPEQVASA
jgi:hypothetical protein